MLKLDVCQILKIGVEHANDGFSRVYVEGDIPYNFMYIDSSGEKVAYLVSLDYIGCDEMSTGRDYKRFEAIGENIKRVEFGVDDVYVYDSAGRVFYAKGFPYEGENRYDEIKNDGSIKIVKVEKELSSDKKEVKVKITIDSKNEIKQVFVNDNKNSKEATKVGEGEYEVVINKNGEYKIIAEDTLNNQDREDLVIRGIGSNGVAPTVTAVVTNGTLVAGVYNVDGNIAKIQISSDTAKYLHIDRVSTEPTSWLPYTSEIEKNYTSEGEKVLYIWVKDENNVVCKTPCELKINVKLDEANKPEPPSENVSGDIEFMITPNSWSQTKKLTITFSEGRQANGYQSMYRTKTSASDWGRWTISYENVVNIDITKNDTQVQAKIIYSSAFKNVDVATGSITVTKIDRTPPKVTSLKVEKVDGKSIIRGTAEDSESGIHSSKPYLITTQQINFKYVTDIDSFAWQTADNIEIKKDARYYFYVRDNANNVGSGTLNAEGTDKETPVIKEINSTPISDYANIIAIAEDNVGVVEYAITKDNSGTVPDTWIKIEEKTYVEIKYNDIKVEGEYTVWVRDASKNVGKASVVVRLNQLPELDTTYPRNLYIKEGTTGEFEVVISKAGYPEVYEYQWKVSKDNGLTWDLVSGATSNKYTFTADYANNNNLYKCEVKHARGTIESSVAKLEVVSITKAVPDAAITEDKEMIAGGVIINKGASSTSNINLTLNIIAINAFEMSISETDTKGAWQTYKENTNYTLQDTSNGTKTINVWIRDENGNVHSQKMTAQIELNK